MSGELVPQADGPLEVLRPAERAPVPVGVLGSARSAAVIAEIRGAMFLAREFPRDRDQARSEIMKACSNWRFADKALYQLDRGRSTIRGASIHLAKELARAWRNLRYGSDVVGDDATTRTLRCWAYDLEANLYAAREITFAKRVFRKGKGYVGAEDWDLQELTNRMASLAVRNCILDVLPEDLVEDAKARCAATLNAEHRRDPQAVRKRLVDAFTEQDVGGAELAEYLGHSLDRLSEEEVEELRRDYADLRDGLYTWEEIKERRRADRSPPAPARTPAEARQQVLAKGQAAVVPPLPSGVVLDAEIVPGAFPSEATRPAASPSEATP